MWVDRTKDEIKNSRAFDKGRHSGDREYHERLEGHYGGSGTAR